MKIILIVLGVIISLCSVSANKLDVTTVSHNDLVKLVNNFKSVLVMFDESHPVDYEADKEFKRLAYDMRYSNDVFLIKIEVELPQDNESESEEYKLFTKLDTNKSEELQLPQTYLFKHADLEKPFLLEDKKFDSIEVRTFIRANSPGTKVVLESCVADLDGMAEEFIKNVKDGGQTILEKVQDYVKDSVDEVRKSGEVYLKIMEKVIERGEMFLASERQRVYNLLYSPQVSEPKKSEIRKRFNILASFLTGSPDQEKNKKKEL